MYYRVYFIRCWQVARACDGDQPRQPQQGVHCRQACVWRIERFSAAIAWVVSMCVHVMS
jgi:hypothetical protein